MNERSGRSCSQHVPETLLHIAMLHKHIESHCDSVGGKLDRALPLATAASTAVRAFTVPRIGRVI